MRRTMREEEKKEEDDERREEEGGGRCSWFSTVNPDMNLHSGIQPKHIIQKEVYSNRCSTVWVYSFLNKKIKVLRKHAYNLSV
jgi:hypothetical protein